MTFFTAYRESVIMIISIILDLLERDKDCTSEQNLLYWPSESYRSVCPSLVSGVSSGGWHMMDVSAWQCTDVGRQWWPWWPHQASHYLSSPSLCRDHWTSLHTAAPCQVSQCRCRAEDWVIPRVIQLRHRCKSTLTIFSLQKVHCSSFTSIKPLL